MIRRPKAHAPADNQASEAMESIPRGHRRSGAPPPTSRGSLPGGTSTVSRPNPKVFDRNMRKPSMRFGRAGTAARSSLEGFLNGVEEGESGGGVGDDEDGDDGGLRDEDDGSRRQEQAEGKKATASDQRRRSSGSAVADRTARESSTPRRPSASTSIANGGGRGSAAPTDGRRPSGSSRRPGRREEGKSDRRSAPVIGVIPSMTDAALKELIETTLNEERSARAPMLKSSASPAVSPITVALMGRVIIPSTKGTSLPVGTNGREKPRVSRSRVHTVCLVMEERAHPAGSSWVGVVKDITVLPGPEADSKTTVVAVSRSWNLKYLSGVEKREKEGATFTLVFESGGSGMAGRESTYTWEGVSSAACDEILWGLLTLHRAGRENESLEAINVSLKELDATAVYHGLATKHPLVPKLARQMRLDERGERTGGGGAADCRGAGTRRLSGGGGRRVSDDPSSGVDKGRRASKTSRWDYEEFEQGEAVLGRLKWLEKGREGLLEELSEELDGLEGGTIQQLIAWSEKTDETETLISLLDEVDKQLEVMEAWLEEHGRPLEAMQVDMSAIERKNNKLEVQWRNYQNLHEYLSNLVHAISISPADEAVLRNPQVVLDAALTNADDDPASAVEKVVASAEALSAALASTEQLARHESTSSLQLLADQRAKLVGVAEVTCSQLVGFCRRLLKRLATQEGTGPSDLTRSSSMVGDTSNQRLLQAQRHFHGYLIDYEPIFSQVRNLEGKGGRRSAELQQAYADDLGQGLLKARIKAYFGELFARVVFQHGTPGLAQMERSAIGDVMDTSAEPMGAGAGPLSLGQLLPMPALKQCLEHTMPAIAREQAFFSTLFGLDPAKDPQARDSAHRMLQVGFAELKASYKRFAAELSDNAFDTLGALALVEDAQSKKQNQSLISMSMLLEFKGLLMQRFSKFIEEQVSWIQGQRGDAKKAGILAAVAKLPTLLKKLQTTAVAAVGSKGREEVGEAQKAYQTLVIVLFKHIEEVAAGNPKYEHIVRLENYHFFAATIRPLKVPCLQEYAVEAEALEEQATTRYLEWLVGYQFPHLTQFFAHVEELVATVGAADVTYHEPRRNLEATLKKQGDMKAVVEGLRATHQRMVKHVTREGQLLGPLWDKLSDTLFAMFSRYEELCTLCYQHTLDPGAMDVKRAATSVGGGASAPISGGRSPMRGDGGELDPESPASSTGLGLEHFDSFSSLTSPTNNNRRDVGVSGNGHRRSNSGGTERLNGSQVSLTSDHSGGAEVEGWSPMGSRGSAGDGESSPVNRGKKFLAKHLRMH